MKTNQELRTERRALYGTFIKKNISGWLFLLPAIILLYFVILRPIIQGAYLSLFDLKGYTPTKFVGFENYKIVLSNTDFIKTLRNTVEYVGISLIVGYLPPLIIALMINEMTKGSGFVKFALYAPGMVPAIVVSMLWYYIYYPDASGLLNMAITAFGGSPQQWIQDPHLVILYIVISMTWSGMGGTMLMYLAAMQGINRELYEAAQIDGAGVFKRIFKITLPEIYGVMLLFFCQQIIGVFQVMEQPLAMTGGGPDGASLSLGLQTYRYAFVYGKTGNSLALGIITFLILLVMTVVYHKMDKKING